MNSIRLMTSARMPIRQRALRLPARQRMSLAVLLLESLDEPADDAGLLKELKKRAADLSSGKVKGLSTQEAYGFSL
jgi:hypothetical protein